VTERAIDIDALPARIGRAGDEREEKGDPNAP